MATTLRACLLLLASAAPTGAIVVSPLRVPIELGDAVVIRVRRERGEPRFDAAAPNATCRFDRDGQNFALAVPPWGHGYDGPSYVDTRATVLDGGALFRHSSVVVPPYFCVLNAFVLPRSPFSPFAPTRRAPRVRAAAAGRDGGPHDGRGLDARRRGVRRRRGQLDGRRPASDMCCFCMPASEWRHFYSRQPMIQCAISR